MATYTQTPPGTLTTQRVWIQSVDVVNHSAMGISNFGSPIYIDTSYYVGSIQVTPTVGDQWMIQKIRGDWCLIQRLAFNDGTNQTIIPTQGQHIIGTGQGPVELQGTTINANGPLATRAYSTDDLPDPTTVAPGTQVYDTDLMLPVWSNGTFWHDAAGNILHVRKHIAASLSSRGTLTGTLHLSRIAKVALSGHGGFTPVAFNANFVPARFSGIGKLTATVPAKSPVNAHFLDKGALTATCIRKFGAPAAMSGTGTLTATTYQKFSEPAAFRD